MIRHKIFLVDSETESAQPLGFNLRASGYQVVTTSDWASVLVQAREQVPTIIVLGVALPDPLRFEICRQLQADSSTRSIPVIILSAHSTEEDRIRGFELGVDDYITKPFSVWEVILRINKSLERTAIAPEPTTLQRMALGTLVLDSFRHEVTLEHKIVHLTPIEFRILELLMKHLGGAIDRKVIHREIWPDTKLSDSRTMDAHVKRLREKLGATGRAIETIIGFGYRLNESLAPLEDEMASKQVQLNELVFAINRMNGGKAGMPGLKKKLNALLALK